MTLNKPVFVWEIADLGRRLFERGEIDAIRVEHVRDRKSTMFRILLVEPGGNAAAATTWLSDEVYSLPATIAESIVAANPGIRLEFDDVISRTTMPKGGVARVISARARTRRVRSLVVATTGTLAIVAGIIAARHATAVNPITFLAFLLLELSFVGMVVLVHRRSFAASTITVRERDVVVEGKRLFRIGSERISASKIVVWQSGLDGNGVVIALRTGNSRVSMLAEGRVSIE